MSYEIKGKLIAKMQLQSGTGSKGEWKKQPFVILVEDKYPKNVCLTAWNKSVETLDNANIDDIVDLKFSIESREYKGNWYTDLKVFSLSVKGKMITNDNNINDLPFNNL